MFELSLALQEFTGMTAITVMFLLAGTVLIDCNRTVSREARTTFIASIVALIFIALADWFMYLTDGRLPELRSVHTVLMAMTFAAAPCIPVAIANTVFPQRLIARWIVVLMAIHAVIELINIWGGFIFWVDDANVYHRGSLYVVYMAVYSISCLFLVVESIRAAQTYQSVRVVAVFAILVCMVVGVIIQIFNHDVRTTWPAVAMTVILYFMFYSDMVLRVDVLTKLLNRHSYEEALAKPPLPCVVVVIDINDFKVVNDTYGHAYGDECLERVGWMIRKTFGDDGLCYRTGGDEFAVVMSSRFERAGQLATELLHEVEMAQQEDRRMPSLSVGASGLIEKGDDIVEAFKSADESMYAMKEQMHASENEGLEE